jgi:hypothetical protein
MLVLCLATNGAACSPPGDTSKSASLSAADASERTLLGAPAIPDPALVAERALVLTAARVAIANGTIAAQESVGLVDALDDGYDRMLAAAPQIERPSSDLMRIDASAGVSPHHRLGVVFLHGYGGSFAIQCWHVAAAMQRARPLTLCPSLGVSGAWWTRRGRDAIEAAIAELRRGGTTQIVLVGLSNGARGAATWASKLDPPPAGVVLLSGAASTAPPRGMPVLVIGGDRDTMSSPRAQRRWAARAGTRGRYVSLSGNHFAFLTAWPDAAAAIDRWLDGAGGVGR